MASATLLYVFSPEDKVYLPKLKALVGTASVFLMDDSQLLTWAQVEAYAKSKKCTGIFSSSKKLLSKLVQDDDKPSLDSYAGSYFTRAGLEIVFIDPLAHLVTVSYGTFLTSRFLSKLIYPQKWNTWPSFSWILGAPSNVEETYNKFQSADFIAVDIETTKLNLAITSISYTAVFLSGSSPSLLTIVFPLDSTFALAWMRKFNSLPVPKITQNGKYDCSYLLRYNAPLTDWYCDTANAFHSWYCELPKDLGILSAFFHREGRYWKDMRDSPDAMVQLEYNGRDTYATAIVFCEWLLQAPEWAKTNYLQEFPVNYGSLLCEMTGIKRDMKEMEIARADLNEELEREKKSLDTMLGVQNFNVGSPKQMKQLLRVLGCGDLESTDEKSLEKAAFRHPLVNRITSVVLNIRGLRKLKSTYLRTDEDKEKPGDKGNKEYRGRILYSLNPHGTETGRLASKEHHFWCGLQIQNITRGPSVKRTLVADDGFALAECDLEQAESRDTGYIAGEEKLIDNVENSPDFHSSNASMFFGVPFEEIYDTEKGKCLNKDLRTLAKPVNHGANYNMGANVLVTQMGLKAIYKASNLLSLPKFWSPKQIAEHLLGCFHKVYTSLRSTYYAGVVAEIKTTKMLKSKAIHEHPFHVAGWVRYCFDDPEKDKRALNAYVAHPPQSLNAMTLNKAFMSVFYDLAMHPEHRKNFRLLAQIHDSILFQFRIGHEYLAEEVRKRMEIYVRVQGYDGKNRRFIVPAAIKAGKDGKGAHRWSETE